MGMVDRVCGYCGKQFKLYARYLKNPAKGQFCSRHCAQCGNKGNINERMDKYRRIDPTTGCWIWTGSILSTGYGIVRVEGRQRLVHRLSYERHYGIKLTSRTQQVNHKCDTPACFNPDHLFLGTQAVNLRDMVAKGRSGCGVKARHAKLTDECVREIRKRHAQGEVQRQLAKEFHISTSTMNSLVLGHSWKHVR